MDEDRPSTLVVKLVLGGIAVVIALTVVGWIIGAIVATLRLVAVIVVIGAIIAVVTSRNDD